ncbi:leucine-rich repeat-containing protein 15-like isoform X1 [Synchiropus splendidus]|uniref:leucine-rich repeat-containing protein 15-like isoform X1 n=1 Tax=Synchiropus splendidus TaxID=270530 RepID=UPI00237ED224|nr:leucine-rich repeat-containing protein 15-like isoform X1 [Synchiropus splendidus]
MECFMKDFLWIILIPLSVQQLSSLCPANCECKTDGVASCSGYDITDIPESLPLTKQLWLRGTSITVVPERSLEKMENLNLLSLTFSHLNTIHPLAFHRTKLLSITLSANDLSDLPAQVFQPLEVLQRLSLNSNRLETLPPGVFDGLLALHFLDLSYNKLGVLEPGVFSKMTKLHELRLSGNSIRRLPATIFHSLTELEELLINDNELEALEAGLFDGLVNLQYLKIHKNQIGTLPPNIFWSLDNLSQLTLSSNQLQWVPERSFYNMPKLTKLTLSENPWNCNCRIRGLALWIKNNQGVVPDRDQVVCHSPNSATPHPLVSILDFDHFGMTSPPTPATQPTVMEKSAFLTTPMNEVQSVTSLATPTSTVPTQGLTPPPIPATHSTVMENSEHQTSPMNEETSAASLATPTSTVTTQGLTSPPIPAAQSTAMENSEFPSAPMTEETSATSLATPGIRLSSPPSSTNTAVATQSSNRWLTAAILIVTGVLLVLASVYGLYCLGEHIDKR